MIKIGREEPIASMYNSGKIIWAKHNEIQTVNIKAVGVDAEVVFEIHVTLLIIVDSRLLFVMLLICFICQIADGEHLPLAVKELGSCDLYPQVGFCSILRECFCLITFFCSMSQ
jgi:coatomer subunit beta'